MKQIDTQVISSQRDEWYPEKKVEFLLVSQNAFPPPSLWSWLGLCHCHHPPLSAWVRMQTSQSLSLLTVSQFFPSDPLSATAATIPTRSLPSLLQPLPSPAFYTRAAFSSPALPLKVTVDPGLSSCLLRKPTDTDHRRNTAFQESISSATQSQRSVNNA